MIKTSKLNSFYKLLFANLLVFFSTMILLEFGGQIYLYLHPVYENHCNIYHKIYGWGLKPNCEFIHAGGRFNAEFKMKIKTNSYGFRGKERRKTKPSSTFRIALMGDSMVLALQVPLKKTAAHILETKLNGLETPDVEVKYEVLNFGIGNFGLGQMFLAYKEIASQFDPDLVLVFINEYLMERTIEYQRNQKRDRPIFRIDKGSSFVNFTSLLDESARGPYFFFNALKNVPLEYSYPETPNNQKPLGIKKNHQSFFLVKLIQNMANDLEAFLKTEKFKILIETNNAYQNKYRYFINFKILDRFSEIPNISPKIVLLDSSSYFDQTLSKSPLSTLLYEFSLYKNYGYINISKPLLKAEDNRVRIRWKGDSHFNEEGQKLFAEAIFKGMKDYFLRSK